MYLRGERKMSLKELSEKSTVPPQTIRRSEKGCRPETAGKIAEAVGVALYEIIKYEGRENDGIETNQKD